MKILIISLLFFTTFVCRSESATVEELTRRAQILLQTASNEIKGLKADGKTLMAEGLEREETLLLELTVELRAALSTGSGVKRLEERLDQLEHSLGAELVKIGKEFVTKREKEEMVRRAQETLNRLTAEIRKLDQQNKTLMAEGLITYELRLVELEVELRASEDPKMVRQLEAVLRSMERVVDEELRRLAHTLKKRDVKDDLIKRAKELQTRAEAEVKQLKAENRTQAAELIAREITNMTAISLQLEKAKSDNEIRELEVRLGQHELRLAQDLRRIGRPLNPEELKDELNRRAVDLTKRAEEEIKLLKSQGKAQVVEVIQKEVNHINELVVELKNATQEAEVRRVEERLGFAEFRLFEELRREGRPVFDRQELERVLRRAEDLAVRATIEIRKLRESGKTLLASGLEREEQYLIELDIELRAATSPDQLKRIEDRLTESEKRIEQELKQLGHKLRKRDLKDDLIKRAEQLEKRATEELIVLKQENRTRAMELIEAEGHRIQQLVKDLKNATETDVKRLEERLRETEARFAEDLRRLGRPINPNELKDTLIKRAEELIVRANEEIKVLKSEDRNHTIEGLQTQEKEITQLVSELKNLTNEQEIRRVEERLGLAEFRLGAELIRLGRPFVNPQRDALIRRAEEIAVRATKEIRKLREEGKGLIAAGLEREERYLIELDVELRIAYTEEQIKKHEISLNEAEKRVEEELRKLGRN